MNDSIQKHCLKNNYKTANNLFEKGFRDIIYKNMSQSGIITCFFKGCGMHYSDTQAFKKHYYYYHSDGPKGVDEIDITEMIGSHEYIKLAMDEQENDAKITELFNILNENSKKN